MGSVRLTLPSPRGFGNLAARGDVPKLGLAGRWRLCARGASLYALNSWGLPGDSATVRPRSAITGGALVLNGVGAFAAVSPPNLDRAEYGVQLGCRVSANVELNGFVDGLVGGNGVGGKLHAGVGIDARFWPAVKAGDDSPWGARAPEARLANPAARLRPRYPLFASAAARMAAMLAA